MITDTKKQGQKKGRKKMPVYRVQSISIPMSVYNKMPIVKKHFTTNNTSYAIQRCIEKFIEDLETSK